MKKVKVIVLRTAGTNCDNETAFAFSKVGADAELVHINELIRKKKKLLDYHILTVPGGFTYGDDIASGKILANEIKYNIRKDIEKFLSCGKLMLGICNGFQVLVKMGLLPALGGRLWNADVTLNLNDSGKFEDRWCYLKRSSGNISVWTKDLPDIIYLPVAHAEGKFIPRNDAALNALKKNKQIAFQYSDQNGKRGSYPVNPNGSIDNIAGISDTTGRVLGMMPHPERFIRKSQHPRWTREILKEEGHGFYIFKNGVEFAKKNLL